MVQHGQVFKLDSTGADGRYGGRGTRRVQRGGFASEHDAQAALDRALDKKLRQANGIARTLTLAELVEQYLASTRRRP